MSLLIGIWIIPGDITNIAFEHCYVAQAGLELMILLPWLPKYWDHRHVPQYQLKEHFI
jgi:hypothetical protein